MASNLEELLQSFPAAFRTWILTQWRRLPVGVRDRVDAVLEATPWGSKAVLRILNTMHQQYGRTFDTRRVRIVVVGPTNAGKSSLVNHLTGREQATVSPIPGTTSRSQVYESGPFLITDTPGADEPGADARREDAFQQYSSADMGLIVFDASVGINRSAHQLYKDLCELNQPHLVLLNKIDLVKGYEGRVQRDAEKRLGTSVIAISCRTGYNVDKVVKAMVMSDPRVINLLAEMLPRYQRRIAWWIVAGAAGTAGAVGWEPIPLADVIPLTFLQTMMVLQIGKVYGFQLTRERARELVAVFAGGWALRLGFGQVMKLIPGPGNLISASYAAAGTMAMGAVAIQWFASDQQMLPEEARAAFRREMDRFRRTLLRRPFSLRRLDEVADAEAGASPNGRAPGNDAPEAPGAVPEGPAAGQPTEPPA